MLPEKTIDEILKYAFGEKMGQNEWLDAYSAFWERYNYEEMIAECFPDDGGADEDDIVPGPPIADEAALERWQNGEKTPAGPSLPLPNKNTGEVYVPSSWITK